MTDSFQWERCDSGGGSCLDIAGATNPTYLAVAADVGKTLRARGYRDGTLVGESAAVGPVLASGSTLAYDTATAYANNRPAFTPTRTVTVTTKTQLDAAIADLRAGDLVDAVVAGGWDYTGHLDIRDKRLASYAAIDLGTGVDAVRITNPDTSNFWAVLVNNVANLRMYGGKIKATGGQGILSHGLLNNFLWWDFYCHDCGNHGVSLVCASDGGGYDGIDIKGETYNCGLNYLAIDNHPEKGTGCHGMIIHDTQPSSAAYNFKNARIAMYVHDQPTGAALEIGGNVGVEDNITIYLKAERLTFVATQQVGGNALQTWGSAPFSNIHVKYLEATDLQGRAVDNNLASGTSRSGITVEYGRASNCCQNPHLASTEPSVSPSQPWDPRGAPVYQDVA